MKNKFRVLIFLLAFKPFLLSSQNNKIGFEVASGLGIGKKFARLDYQLGVFRYWNLTDYSRFQLGLNISRKNINANCDFGVTIYRSLINQNLNPQFNGMYHTSLLFSVDDYFRNK